MKSLRAKNILNANVGHYRTWTVFGRRLQRARALFPLTALGVLVAVVTTFGLSYFGFAQLDLVWYVAALCGLALIALALLSVLSGVSFMRRSMHNEVPATPQKSVTGVACKTGFMVPEIRWFPVLDTQLSWNEPTDAVVEVRREDNQLQEWVTPCEHGDITQIERRVRISDVLGLASVTLRYRSAGNLAVLPNLGALGKIPWLASLNGGEDLPHPLGAAVGDRTELRRYHSGDPARFIHWKAFARTRKLMQREPERSLSRTQRTAAYLVAGPGDGASAAAALTVLLTANLGLDFLFGADGTTGVIDSRSEIESAVRHSATQRSCGGKNLARFTDTVVSGGAANFMLFVPALGGEWELKVRPLLQRSELACKVVIGIDGLDQAPVKPFWYRLALQTETATGHVRGELNQLVKRLESAGAIVLIADRGSGRLLSGHHLGTGAPQKKIRGKGALRAA